MKRDLERLSQKTYDLLIIGGGITGAATAHDAALRGLSVALVERRDFGSATSAATSKLVHGGLRYLRTLEVSLVRESLRERRILEYIAPHLVAPIPFMVPCYRHSASNLTTLTAGMMLYDRLSFDKARLDDIDRKVPRWSRLSRDEALVREPELKIDRLTGAVVYHDCQMVSPDRLTWEFVEGAMENGAEVANYAEVVSLRNANKTVEGAVVRDALTGREYEISARMTINAAGPWADFVTQMLGKGHEKRLVRSQGIHMITRPLAKQHALVLTTKVGRVFFIIPWRGRSLIGTTDTRYDGHPDEYRVTRSGLETFIGEINEALPSANLTTDDIEWSYGGLRPIVENDTALRDVNKASRKYEIYDHKKEDRLSGMLTVVGGKYTTSRALAERLTEIACTHLNMPRPSRTTAGHILPGGRIGSWAGAKTRLMREYDVHSDDAAILLAHYGKRALPFLAEAKANPELAAIVAEGKPEPLAVVDMAVRDEMALHLDDVLFRRTGLATTGRLPESSVTLVADRMATLLGWDAAQRATEVEGVIAKLRSRGFADA